MTPFVTLPATRLRDALRPMLPLIPRTPKRDPQIQHVWMHANSADQTLMLVTTDAAAQTFLRHRLPATVRADTVLLCPPRPLTRIVGCLHGEIGLGLTVEHRIEVQADTGTYLMPARAVPDPAAFPPFPSEGDGPIITYDVLAWLHAVRTVLPFMARENARPMLTTLRWELDPGVGMSRLVTADGYALALAALSFPGDVPVDHPPATWQFPRQVVTNILTWRDVSASPLCSWRPAVTAEGQSTFHWGERTLSFRLSQEAFPGFQHILDQVPIAAAPRRIVMSTADIQTSIKRAKRILSGAAPVLDLRPVAEGLSLTAHSPFLDRDTMIYERVAARMEGTWAPFVLDARYLVSALAHTSAAQVTIFPADHPHRVVLFMSAERGGELRVYIMPMTSSAVKG